ncbi:MAG: tyrosine-type recombinase/integrase [Solirubrobacterales bacterium]|nr:tyrosine-type recombinase/integrase [Solirubrobacterales bacterium]
MSSIDPVEQLAGYERWLESQPLAMSTRRAYRGHARRFVEFLASWPGEGGDPLVDAHARDYAVRDFKSHLKTVRRAKPASVNLALAAMDHFYRYLGAGRPDVRREELAQAAPRALSPEELRRFLRAVERRESPRDRAIALLLVNTALRIGECAALDVDDIAVSARKGMVVVREGKGDAYREVPLNAEARAALDDWTAVRRGQLGASADRGLFISRKGARLSTRAIDLVIRSLASDAELTLSAHTLRHTCLTRLVRGGADIVLVAELAGHRRLETTRRYSLPSQADRQDAMERLQVEY